MDNNTQFAAFAANLMTKPLDICTTATGSNIISQRQRNAIRKDGVAALKADLTAWYGDTIDIVETKDGICLVIENEANDVTVTWELKSTIKSVDCDPFIDAQLYEDDCHNKEARAVEREAAKNAKIAALEAKRAAKIAEIQARNK